MYRISVTSLEAFRRFRDNHSIWDTEERLLNVLSGKKEPNAYATIGSCFHKIVETGKATYVGNGIFEQEEDGVVVRLNSKTVENAIYYRNKYPNAQHEVHGGKDFHSSLFDIHVHGYADVKYDKIVRDIKTKYSTPHTEDYTKSCQWTFYLEVFNCSTFYFDLFQFGGYRRSMLTDVVYTEFIPYEPIECVRTIDSEKYNQYIVEDFCNYIHTNNLYHLLKTKEELYTP